MHRTMPLAVLTAAALATACTMPSATGGNDDGFAALVEDLAPGTDPASLSAADRAAIAAILSSGDDFRWRREADAAAYIRANR
jgi:hypothetical protein